MSVFHLFQIENLVSNRATHHKYSLLLFILLRFIGYISYKFSRSKKYSPSSTKRFRIDGCKIFEVIQIWVLQTQLMKNMSATTSATHMCKFIQRHNRHHHHHQHRFRRTIAWKSKRWNSPSILKTTTSYLHWAHSCSTISFCHGIHKSVLIDLPSDKI